MKKRLICALLAALTVLAAVNLTAFSAFADIEPVFTVTKTDVRADGVYITGGYGCIKTREVYDERTGDVAADQRVALIDRNGDLLFDWKDTYMEYTVSGDIVSLAGVRYQSYKLVSGAADKPAFFTLDGKDAFDYSDIAGATPMIGGRAVVFNTLLSLADGDPSNPVVINEKGEVLCTLPDEFRTVVSVGMGSNVLAWECVAHTGYPGEGLIPCSERKDPEDRDKGFKLYYLDDAGNKALDLTDCGYVYGLYPFHYGYAMATAENGKIGFINRSGELVVPAEYDAAGENFGEIANVCKDGKWGYINMKNEVVVPFEYDYAYGGENGYAVVVKNGKCGIVNYDNNVVVPFEYDDMSGYEDGVAYAVKDGDVYIITLNNPFADVVADKWYTKAALYCWKHGYMNGTGAGMFSPNNTLTRAMFVTILAQIDGADLSTYTGSSFKDVPAGKWFSKPIEWAAQNGYAGGTGNGNFSPNADITRETLAQFFYTYSVKKGYVGDGAVDLSKYSDFGEISKWAVNAVSWAVGADLISGTGATTISPKMTASRAQVAVIIMNYVENVVKSH